ncbi:uncharacterized protein PGTG_21552 [Puccinia graminis f. sp. tritici CRL 75-36-700-3]|uniref:C2H2-type domain-containing protein n=1 Tax=Puccinia graminis f. sp. tritici (strain CRL 75-36-700-3 / race SCCL) TaxID=418459 RepID=H6QRY4_PUCGT|nr:uncharacterized protein PGTG_21552 [Puccinia graminis f. sp. tritici CRL 75-36-700-3]EHS63419.1 hypothetical protein PGTG_21552 [Puccinia graminis f. sp. tritici CRL 75-36-700-3]
MDAESRKTDCLTTVSRTDPFLKHRWLTLQLPSPRLARLSQKKRLRQTIGVFQMMEGFTRVPNTHLFTCDTCGLRRMSEKRIRIHRSLESHQRKLTQARSRNHRNRQTSTIHATVTEPSTPIQEEDPRSDGMDNHNRDNEVMEDEMENPVDVANGNQEAQEVHARELRRALDLIRGMTSEDFFDLTEERAGVPEEYDRMDWLYDEMDAECMDGPGEHPNDDDEDDEANSTNDNEWYPFKNKMELVGSLLIGYTRHILSRDVFDEIRVIFRILCQIKIPAWSTIRRAQERIRKHLEMEVQFSNSVWGTPCASVGIKKILKNELANPLVAPHLEFYPQESNGCASQ